MQWLRSVANYVWEFLALVVGLALFFGPIQEIANAFGKYVAGNAMMMVGLGVIVIAAAAVHYMIGSDGGSSGQSSGP